MDAPKSITELKQLCLQQIERCKKHTESESSMLLYGDLSEYKRGGKEALEVVVKLLIDMGA